MYVCDNINAQINRIACVGCNLMNNIKNDFVQLDSFLYRTPRYAHNFRSCLHTSGNRTHYEFTVNCWPIVSRSHLKFAIKYAYKFFRLDNSDDDIRRTCTRPRAINRKNGTWKYCANTGSV